MGKKTFVFYNDWEDYTECMTLEETGLFLQTILKYQKGEELGDIGPIKYIRPRVKKQLDEDNAKRESEIDKRSKAGIEGNKKRRGENRKKSQVIASAINRSQVIADNVNENDNVISGSSGSSNSSNEELNTPPNSEKGSKRPKKINIKEGVNQVIQRMKKACDDSGTYYAKGKQERFYANHIREQHGELKKTVEKEKKTLEAFIKNVIFISSHAFIKEAFTPQLFYENYAAILNGWRKMDLIDQQKVMAQAKADTPIGYAKTLDPGFREVAIERVTSYEAGGRKMDLVSLKKRMETFRTKGKYEDYLQRFLKIFSDSGGDETKLL